MATVAAAHGGGDVWYEDLYLHAGDFAGLAALIRKNGLHR
jgi:hypothetical protein